MSLWLKMKVDPLPPTNVEVQNVFLQGSVHFHVSWWEGIDCLDSSRASKSELDDTAFSVDAGVACLLLQGMIKVNKTGVSSLKPVQFTG